MTKWISRLTMLTVKKQRPDIFLGQKLVDYRKCQVDYRIYKSTNKGYKSTNRLMMCMCVQNF